MGNGKRLGDSEKRFTDGIPLPKRRQKQTPLHKNPALKNRDRPINLKQTPHHGNKEHFPPDQRIGAMGP